MRTVQRAGLALVIALSLAMLAMAIQAPYEVTRGEQSQETINAVVERRLAALESMAPLWMSMNDKLNLLLGSLGVIGLGGAGMGIRRQMRKSEDSE